MQSERQDAPATTEARFVLDVSPDAASVAIARLFAAAVARGASCSEDAIEDLKLAVSEALTNAVKEHQAATTRDPVRIAASVESDVVVFDVIDRGRGPDAIEGRLEAKDQELTPAPGLYEGSLGLTVIQALYPKAEIERNAHGGTTVRLFADRSPE